MKEAVLKEILYDLKEAISILEQRDPSDYEKLKELSNHAIEDVAVHKDFDVVSVTVLLYSIYKVLLCLQDESYKKLLQQLRNARKNLSERKLGAYNNNIKRAFNIVSNCNAKVKEHLQDVLQAARIKKGTVLLQKGLSIGQAAGLMGLSNWDLQEYASHTKTLSEHTESRPALERLQDAFDFFDGKNKTLFFDAGPVITLVMSRMIHLLPELKEKTGATFYITPGVKYELVDRPLQTRRFEFEALQVLRLIREGVLEIYENVPQKQVDVLIKRANATFKVKGKYLDIIQKGEVEAVSCALQEKVPVVMDERTLRLFIENNTHMKRLLEGRFKRNVELHADRMNEFSDMLSGVTILRSIELVSVAYKLGLLDTYLPQIKNGKQTLVDAMLWTTKYNGCAVTDHEVEEIKEKLLK